MVPGVVVTEVRLEVMDCVLLGRDRDSDGSAFCETISSWKWGYGGPKKKIHSVWEMGGGETCLARTGGH